MHFGVSFVFLVHTAGYQSHILSVQLMDQTRASHSYLGFMDENQTIVIAKSVSDMIWEQVVAKKSIQTFFSI